TEGVDLIRRMRGEHAYGLTSPLLTLPSGAKMGKTSGGTRAWLDPKRTSPYQFFQYWMGSDDEQVGRYLRFYTFLDHDTIDDLERQTVERPEQRAAQRTLATEVTTLVHGADAADQAKRASEILFSAEIATLDEATLVDVMDEAPSIDRSRTLMDEGDSVVAVLVSSGLCASKSDARRQLDQKAVYLNNVQVIGERPLSRGDLLHDRYLVVRRGRRTHALVRYV